MTLPHAVVWLDHHKARVQQFSASEAHLKHVKDHEHDTGHHHSDVRTQHEFFGEVCDALDGAAEVLITSSHIVAVDFKHYVEKHRPAEAKLIAGWETVNELTDNEVLALARKFFVGHDRMTGTGAMPTV